MDIDERDRIVEWISRSVTSASRWLVVADILDRRAVLVLRDPLHDCPKSCLQTQMFSQYIEMSCGRISA